MTRKDNATDSIIDNHNTDAQFMSSPVSTSTNLAQANEPHPNISTPTSLPSKFTNEYIPHSVGSSNLESRYFDFESYYHLNRLEHLNSFISDADNSDIPQFPKHILPINPEYDMMRKHFFVEIESNQQRNDNQNQPSQIMEENSPFFDSQETQQNNEDDSILFDRSKWDQKLLQESPEVKDFIERVDPVQRAASFGRLFLPQNRLADQQILLALISQHLRTLGLVRAQSSLHSEWDPLCQPNNGLDIPAHLHHSQLLTILQTGIGRAERFWELAMPSVEDLDNIDTITFDKEISTKLDEEISKTFGGTPFTPEDTKSLLKEQLGEKEFFHVDDEIVPTEMSLNQLIWLLTTNISNYSVKDNDKFIDLSQVKVPETLLDAVCLMYESFTTSKVFFMKIRERFKLAFSEPNEFVKCESILRTFKVFKTWINYQQDAMDQQVREAVRLFNSNELNKYVPSYTRNTKSESCSNLNTFTQTKSHTNPSKTISTSVSFDTSISLSSQSSNRKIPDFFFPFNNQNQKSNRKLMFNDLSNLAGFFNEKAKQTNQNKSMTPEKKMPTADIGNCKDNFWNGKFTIFEIPPIEVARQMTIISSSTYYAISPNELLDQAWTDPRMKHRAPNVVILLNRFDMITRWVQTVILTEKSLQERLAKMRFLIEVMIELEKIQNYLDYMSIFHGFMAPCIRRLQLHKSKLPGKIQNELENAEKNESFDNNSQAIRDIHTKCFNSHEPSLPFLVILLKDIHNYEETKTFIDGLINIRKCTRKFELIKEVEKFKKYKYCFLPIEQIADKLSENALNEKSLDDDTLDELSNECEPPDAFDENQLLDIK